MGEGRGMEIWDAKEEKVKFESSPVRSTSNNKNKKSVRQRGDRTYLTSAYQARDRRAVM